VTDKHTQSYHYLHCSLTTLSSKGHCGERGPRGSSSPHAFYPTHFHSAESDSESPIDALTALRRTKKLAGNVAWIVITSAFLIRLLFSLILDDEAEVISQGNASRRARGSSVPPFLSHTLTFRLTSRESRSSLPPPYVRLLMDVVFQVMNRSQGLLWGAPGIV